jgi:hypothetical protein
MFGKQGNKKSSKKDKYINLKKELKTQQKEEFLLKHYFKRKWDLKKVKEGKAPDIASITQNVAFVIDGRVADIIHCQDKMAAILLSSPEIVLIPEGKFARPGWEYKDGKFIDPHSTKSHH